VTAGSPAPATLAPSAEELVRALAVADEALAEAGRSCGEARHRLEVSGESIDLVFAGERLAEGVVPSFAHKERSSNGGAPALTIQLCDAATSGRAIPLPPCLEEASLRRAEFPTYRSRRIETLYDWDRRVLHMLDRELRRAIYWTEDAAAVPLWEHAGSLRQILVWWLRDGPLQLLHAGAVGREDGGVLLVGRSGSGKSTSTAACVASGLRIVGDDTVLARADPFPVAESLYGSVKLTPDGLERFPALGARAANEGRDADEKAIVYLSEALPGKLVEALPLRALLIPKIVARAEARLLPARPAQGLLALAPSTLFQANGAHRGAFRVLAQIVEKLPAYVLEVGTDATQIPRVIEALLDGEVPRG